MFLNGVSYLHSFSRKAKLCVLVDMGFYKTNLLNGFQGAVDANSTGFSLGTSATFLKLRHFNMAMFDRSPNIMLRGRQAIKKITSKSSKIFLNTIYNYHFQNRLVRISTITLCYINTLLWNPLIETNNFDT